MLKEIMCAVCCAAFSSIPPEHRGYSDGIGVLEPVKRHGIRNVSNGSHLRVDPEILDLRHSIEDEVRKFGDF